MTYVFRESGRYFGYIAMGALYTAAGEHAGWMDGNGCVWDRNATYLGQLVDDAYVLRSLTQTEPAADSFPRAPAELPVPPAPPDRRAERHGPPWIDGLAVFAERKVGSAE